MRGLRVVPRVRDAQRPRTCARAGAAARARGRGRGGRAGGVDVQRGLARAAPARGRRGHEVLLCDGLKPVLRLARRGRGRHVDRLRGGGALLLLRLRLLRCVLCWLLVL